MTVTTVIAKELLQQITVQIRVAATTKARLLWLGTQFIMLGARIAGVKAEVTSGDVGNTVALPRRQSVNDPDFNQVIGAATAIFVDGVEQDRVVGYDIDRGEVVRRVVDAAGNLVLADNRLEAETEVVRGVVTLGLRGVQGLPSI